MREFLLFGGRRFASTPSHSWSHYRGTFDSVQCAMRHVKDRIPEDESPYMWWEIVERNDDIDIIHRRYYGMAEADYTLIWEKVGNEPWELTQ